MVDVEKECIRRVFDGSLAQLSFYLQQTHILHILKECIKHLRFYTSGLLHFHQLWLNSEKGAFWQIT